MLSGSTPLQVEKLELEILLQKLLQFLGFSAVRNKDLFTHLLFAENLSSSKPSKKIFAINKIIESVTEFDVIDNQA